MWWRSASFILDQPIHQQNDAAAKPESRLLSNTTTASSSMAETLQQNPNPSISAYYQTRAAHHGVVTSDWLAQAQAAVGRDPDDLPPENPARPSEEPFSVINDFNSWRKQPDLAEAVAAIRALASVIRSSEATTVMELEIELKKASDSLKCSLFVKMLTALFTQHHASWLELSSTGRAQISLMDRYDRATSLVSRHVSGKNVFRHEIVLLSWDTTSISLTAGCDLFMRYVTRTSALEYEDFNSAKSRLLERAEKFGEISYKARKIIAMLSQDFIFDGCTILVHGFSRVVLEVLKTAAESRKLFRVFCTGGTMRHEDDSVNFDLKPRTGAKDYAEKRIPHTDLPGSPKGRPDRTGLRLSNELAKLDVPVKLLIDSAVAYSMDEVDMVFVGADGVVESGGVINMMGTYQIALVAKSMNKPVYVAAESFKFARLYPLDQKDMVPALRPIDFGVPIPSKVEVETSARDYTPPQYLTLLFTDLGVLTPSVVSDELIQLYL
ncbi:hypothetical protein RJ640_008347 [Escallonia rubra]|uniref:Translation initiation factor eIF2B subunit alpha n=1 Tax=Escallonia rubra TaxID=112253 RepID=A0AA88UC99_9ASTE|nr:hypothetical protein RJ640_008347 [Escallonia rubra]